MNIQNLADRRAGIHPFGKSPAFIPPIKIDEASPGEEGGAEVQDIPFYKPYRQGGPHPSGPPQGHRPRRLSLDRAFDPNSSRRPSPNLETSANILKAQVDIPQRMR